MEIAADDDPLYSKFVTCRLLLALFSLAAPARDEDIPLVISVNSDLL
jgi:hypothetical protein